MIGTTVIRRHLTLLDPRTGISTDAVVEGPDSTPMDAVRIELERLAPVPGTLFLGDQPLPDGGVLADSAVAEGTVLGCGAPVPPLRISAASPGVDLRVIGGPAAGTVLALLPRPRAYEVGRGKIDLPLPVDDLLSRRHFSILISDSAVEVEDLGSSNGTWFEGVAERRRTLGEGDVFKAGGSLFQVTPSMAPELTLVPQPDARLGVNRRFRGGQEELDPPPAGVPHLRRHRAPDGIRQRDHPEQGARPPRSGGARRLRGAARGGDRPNGECPVVRDASLACCRALARSLVVQAAVLHAPAELRVVVLGDERGAESWDWVRWLPHARWSNDEPFVLVGSDPTPFRSRTEELRDLTRQRQDRLLRMRNASFSPDVIVVIDDLSALSSDTVIGIVRDGPPVGVHAITIDRTLVPEGCNTSVTFEVDVATVERIHQGGLSSFACEAPASRTLACPSTRSSASFPTRTARAPDARPGASEADARRRPLVTA